MITASGEGDGNERGRAGAGVTVLFGAAMIMSKRKLPINLMTSLLFNEACCLFDACRDKDSMKLLACISKSGLDKLHG